MGPRRRWLAVGVPAALLLGVLTTASLRPAVDGCPGAAASVLRPQQAQVPGLEGLDEDAARVVAERAGVPWQARERTWRVDGTARGTVLEQSGGGCDETLRLVLSTGGPLVDPAAQAPAERQALGSDPGPVRAARYEEGLALQSDDTVTGECAAVERLQREEALGPDVTVSCHPRAVDALVQAVADLSPFLGPGPGDDVRVLQTRTGAWLSEAGAGWVADRAAGGWRLTVRVGSGRGLSDLRCDPASAYEVCDVDVRPDGTQVATLQVLGERPPGQTFVRHEAVLQDGEWRVRVVLAPDQEGPTGPDRPTAPPAGPDTLLALADAARAAVVPYSPAP